MSYDEIDRLLKAGKTAEARKLMERLREEAANTPDEAGVRADGSTYFKRRGRLVVEGADGKWVRKNPPKKTKPDA